MKQILLFGFGLLFTLNTSWALSLDLSNGSSANKNQQINILSEFLKYNKIQNELENKKFEQKAFLDAIKQLENEKQAAERKLSEPGQKLQKIQKEINDIDKELSALAPESETLEADLEKLQQTLEKKAEQRSDAQEKLRELQEEQDKVAQKLEEETQAFKLQEADSLSQIDVLENNLKTQIVRLKSSFNDLIRKISFALLLIIGLKIIQRVIPKLVDSTSLTAKRKRIIKHLSKAVINTLLVLILLLFFFSQLLFILPYFAIFLTVITLALKDVILSFIGWFVVGLKDGFKLGDFIVWNTYKGTVVEINPINTIIREGGLSGPSGRMVTIPNKNVFLHEIINWSRWNKYAFVTVDYYFMADINLEKIEAKLKDALKTQQSDPNPSIKKKIGEEHFEPLTYWHITRQGLQLRGKILVHFDDYYETPSILNKLFIQSLNPKEKESFHFTNTVIES